MNLRTLYLGLAFIFISSLNAQTTVSPVITTDQVWDAAGSPYLINQNTFIDSGVVVTMLPGSELIGSGAYRKIDIDGELNMLGNKDSLIHVSGLQIYCSAVSAQHHRSLNKAVEISFASIKGTGVANRAFSLRGGIDFNLTNSIIDSAYYCIQYQGDRTVMGTLRIDSSEIYGVEGSSINQGSILYCLGYDQYVHITNSILGKGRTVYAYGDVLFENNQFIDLSGSLELGRNTGYSQILRCNTFINAGSIGASFYGSDGQDEFRFVNNTIDSLSQTTLSLYSLVNSNDSFPPMTISYNNFTGTGLKVKLRGNNSNPVTSDKIDFTNNFWGTTDTTVMDSFITDYKDDINIATEVDYSNYLSAKVIGCPNSIDPCPTPGFIISLNTHNVTIIDTTNAGPNVTRIWNFGNGFIDTTTNDTLYHSYTNSGDFDICLYILNSSGNICDSLCQTVTIPSFFACQSSYYVTIDTSEPYNLYVIENSENTTANTTYSWDFGDGNQSQNQTPTHYYSSFGKYELCLTINEPSTSCVHTFCDSIGMDSDGNPLKRDGFTIHILNEGDVGVNRINQISNISIAPNPSNGLFTIEAHIPSSEMVSVTIQDLSGRVIYKGLNESKSNDFKATINLVDLNNGMYLIKLQSGNYQGVKRLIISK